MLVNPASALAAKCLPGKEKRTIEPGFIAKISERKVHFSPEVRDTLLLRTGEKMKSITLLLNIDSSFIITASFLLPSIPQLCEIMPTVLIKFADREPEDQFILGFTLCGGRKGARY